jgi:5S rRNA maturation endonuclease (ribonuclease M5)
MKNTNNQDISIDVISYLSAQGVSYQVQGKNINFKCPFNEHQNDKPGKYGMYMNANTTQYFCHKCHEKGNIIILCQKLGWQLPKELKTNKITTVKKQTMGKPELSTENRIYLNSRGLSDAVIEWAELGEKKHKGSMYISIPIYTSTGELEGYKLREFPKLGKQKLWDRSKTTVQLYGPHILENHPHLKGTIVLITEGELDTLAVLSQGYAAVSGTNGAGTWRDDWSKYLLQYESVYIVLDNDTAGISGAKKIAESLWKVGYKNINIINLPTDTGMKDVGELIENGVSVEYIIKNYATAYPPVVSTEGFTEMGVVEVAQALDPVIKMDYITKVTMFIACLGVFTQKHVLNIAMNGESSTGKTFIAKNIINLFPRENVFELGNASKKAFFHMNGEYDKESNTSIIDFENKIILILDAPSTELMETLRSFLSQDSKEITSVITDKDSSGSQKTKTIVMRGPACFVICSADLARDQQESTRLLVLSPEVSRDKSEIAIDYRIREASDHTAFRENTVEHPSIQMLRNRIEAIKRQRIGQVDIPDSEYMRSVYLANTKDLQPRHSRDFHRFKALIAGFTMLNYVWRQKKGENTLIATQFDIDQAGILWSELSEPQELGVTPNVLSLYKEVILPCYLENTEGITIKQIREYHFKVRHSHIYDKYLKSQILSVLEIAGMIEQAQDYKDKRIKRYTPVYGLPDNSSAEMWVENIFESFSGITEPVHRESQEEIEIGEHPLFEDNYQKNILDTFVSNNAMYGINS